LEQEGHPAYKKPRNLMQQCIEGTTHRAKPMNQMWVNFECRIAGASDRWLSPEK